MSFIKSPTFLRWQVWVSQSLKARRINVNIRRSWTIFFVLQISNQVEKTTSIPEINYAIKASQYQTKFLHFSSQGQTHQQIHCTMHLRNSSETITSRTIFAKSKNMDQIVSRPPKKPIVSSYSQPVSHMITFPTHLLNTHHRIHHCLPTCIYSSVMMPPNTHTTATPNTITTPKYCCTSLHNWLHEV